LDYALWRRFDDVFEIPLPTSRELTEVLQGELHGTVSTEAVRQAAEQLAGLPHAAAERAARDALRAALLANSRQVTSSHLDEAVIRALSRRWT
jgi:SpoVK/Ycf46/Vps4 family AAA+-type ATPase